MRTLYRLLAPLILLCSSCEKEIAIDYHEADKQYVVEASVTDEGMVARISQTNAMDNNSGNSDVSEASVTVSGNNGTSQPLTYTRNGFYRASQPGIPGVTYTIDITVDGNHFTSTSVMQQPPRADSFRVVRKKIMTEWIQMGELYIQDRPNEDNWYFMHIYRNNLGYRWAVMNDRNDPGQKLQQLFTFFREGDKDSDVLRDGDELRVEIRAIDQRAYDYLYSMQMMESTGTNPIANFTGGCLGYFSAHSQLTLNHTYYASTVETEEGE